MSLVFSLLVYVAYLFEDFWQFQFCNLPNDVEVHAEVIMDQPISRSRHAFPRHFLMRASKFFRELLGSLAQNFYIANDSILSSCVVCKRLVSESAV